MNDQAWTPYCGPAPDPSAWLGRWNLDPVLLAVMGLAFVLLWRGWAREGRSALIAASVVLAISFISPLCALSSALFTARTLHHLLLILAAAPLLALALPGARKSRLLPAAAVHVVIFWAWHAPGAYASALSSDAVYWAMQLSLLASGTWFWMGVRKASAPAAIVGLLAVMLGMGLLGALIAFAGQPIYAPHFATTLAWGMTPLEDQQAAGLIMWAPAAAAYLAAALWRLSRLLSPRAEAAA
jgi:putative membrane protein